MKRGLKVQQKRISPQLCAEPAGGVPYLLPRGVGLEPSLINLFELKSDF